MDILYIKVLAPKMAMFTLELPFDIVFGVKIQIFEYFIMFENHRECLISQFFNFAIFTNFFLLKLACNTIWPQTLGFQKLTERDHF